MSLLSNLLEVSLQLNELNGEISLGFLEKFIGILIGAVGITGLGIIIYCLILKAVTLPLDIWQKASMRSQSLKMEQMRGQLEKLQKQYQNQPELYQKKMQEVYRQNNYSLLASCLPMLATLLILIFAFQSLTTYSQYRNLTIYTDMNAAYNQAILSHYDETVAELEEIGSDGITYVIKRNTAENDKEHYVYSRINKDVPSQVEYYLDVEKMLAANPSLKGATDAESEANCRAALEKEGAQAAAASYQAGKNNQGFSFLWVKNIYYPDVAWANPLQNYKSFTGAITREIVKEDGSKVKIADFIDETTYNKITSELVEEKSTPNGFFILVALTILVNLGSQFITMRSQKAQRELQTADKSQESMQKWMMFLMPVLFTVFAFIYSGAFSLYLITSSLFSLLSTLVINRIIDARFKSKAAKAAETTQKGRVNLTRDWQKNDELKNKKNNKNK
ncbi:MAG: membrane protein insertase YidC [Clostridia bacterium]|nr:membrane protein insertase YidC [Clostridia bacterium]